MHVTCSLEQYVQGNISWVPLQNDNGYRLWRTGMISLHGLKLGANGSVVGDKANYYTGARAIFDTGVGGITVPRSAIGAIFESIGMNFTAILNHDHTPLCTEFNSSWAVEFELGPSTSPVSVTLRGDQLAVPGYADEEKYCFPPFSPGDDEDLFLIGTGFLQKVYTVFDFGSFQADRYNPRIGFGQLKEEWRP